MNSVELKKLVGRNVKKYRFIYNAYNKEKLTQKDLASKIGARTPLIGALELSLIHIPSPRDPKTSRMPSSA